MYVAFSKQVEWQQVGSTYYTMTDKEFLCFTDELRCRVPAEDFTEAPLRKSATISANSDDCHGYKMSVRYKMSAELKNRMLVLVPDDNEV